MQKHVFLVNLGTAKALLDIATNCENRVQDNDARNELKQAKKQQENILNSDLGTCLFEVAMPEIVIV